jgi:hypothetical protein
MEEATENGKELSHSAYGSGMSELMDLTNEGMKCRLRVQVFRDVTVSLV